MQVTRKGVPPGQPGGGDGLAKINGAIATIGTLYVRIRLCTALTGM